jgi:ABC-type maltose transport system permease subunit
MSQNDLVHKVIIGTDTGMWIPQAKIKNLNIQFARLDYFKEMCDSLKKLSYTLSLEVSHQKDLIYNYDQQISLQQKEIGNQYKEIQDYKDLDKSNQNKVKWLKLQRNVLAVAVIVAVMKIYVFK